MTGVQTCALPIVLRDRRDFRLLPGLSVSVVRLRRYFRMLWLLKFSISVSRLNGCGNIEEIRPVIVRLNFVPESLLCTGLDPCFGTGRAIENRSPVQFFSKIRCVFSQTVDLYDVKFKGQAYRTSDHYRQRILGDSMRNARFSSKNPVSGAVSAGNYKKT